ncbi:MAG TPA: hypothetical protein VL500_04695 [Candidatus Eisenbacteria bacterium]|nr:hypothetical protein [Candidatus Eisenbacteria bacterium]
MPMKKSAKDHLRDGFFVDGASSGGTAVEAGDCGAPCEFIGDLLVVDH